MSNEDLRDGQFRQALRRSMRSSWLSIAVAISMVPFLADGCSVERREADNLRHPADAGAGGDSTSPGGATFEAGSTSKAGAASEGGATSEGGSTSKAGATSEGGSTEGGTADGGSAGVTGLGGNTPGMGGATGMGGSANKGGSASTNGGAASTGNGGAASTGNGGANTTGNGGSTASSCATYDGALKADSTIFIDGYGTSGTGASAWMGYAYTFSYGKGTAVPTIKPGSSTTMSCFTGKVVCTNGTIPASDDAGGGLGWSIAEPKSGTGGTVALSGSIKFQLKGAVLGMRVGIAPGDYCYTLTDADVTAANGAGLTLKASAFKTECWGSTGKAFADGSMAQGFQVALPGNASWTAAKAFDYCIVSIGPG